MMTRTLMLSLAMASAMGMALPAYAQVTDQTDQSEEDWRKSRKKSGSSDIYRQPNSTSTGVGAPIIDYKPVSPVERLPSDSRRHLMRERAKAIAESDDGDISDAEYVPSEQAKSDEQLMREEKDAWDVIVTDAKGNGGTAKSEGGPNKVAVTGRNGATPAPGSRGGSTRTLQEIMDAIKNGQSGGGSADTDASPASTDSGPLGQSGSQDQAGQSSSGETSEGQDASQGDAQAEGQSQASGQSQSDGSQSGGEGDSDTQASSQASASSSAEPLSPLERIRRTREEQPARGTERSASDYLGTKPDED